MSEPLTAEQIAELRELYERTTKGEWRWASASPDQRHGILESATGDDALWGADDVRILTDGSARGEYVPDIDVMGPDAQFIAAAHNAMPGLFATLAEKDAVLTDAGEAYSGVLAAQYATLNTLRAELQQKEADHQLTIDTFRQQERIWEQKFAEKLATELDAMKIEIESRLTAELQQANERIQQLEREASAREARPAECEDIECHYDYPHLPRGDMCATHGLAVLVTHVDDSEPCSDYLTASRPAPEKPRSP